MSNIHEMNIDLHHYIFLVRRIPHVLKFKNVHDKTILNFKHLDVDPKATKEILNI